ncbi:phage tail protein [Lacticaseibacillus pantheris]|jgi:hypothetical protein|uniref:phage tail protein n=1 Tax=Lacticaseibacillus pantheris TaxID=171523 RepID=UPI002658A1E0|nr:phage tail protein [Lacticaseibacillus pantheris]WKF85152.1 phage tail protein [Lacticaseibacillus pantheris]
MAYQVDFKDVSKVGLTSSPVASALAGLRANEARYFWNKYKVPFITYPASEQPAIVDYVNTVLAERDITITAQPLEVAQPPVDGTDWTYVIYANGLCVNVLYEQAAGGKRAVGFKLSDGMDVPASLADKFKFVRQRSKLAGTIRGSYFVIKGEYSTPAIQ